MRFMQKNYFSRRAVAIILSGALVATPVVAPVAAYADDAAQSQATASSADLQKQLDEANAQLDSLQQVTDQAEAELGKTNYDLDQTKSQIADLENQIAENEKQLDEAKQQLTTVLKDSYTSDGNTGLINMVLDSKNFEDFVSNVFYANKVADNRQDAIQKVNELQASLKEKKSALEEQKKQQEELLATQQAQVDAAKQAESQQQSYINQLSDQVKQAIAEERAREAEESRKAAEAVLAQQQAEAAASNGGTEATTTNGGTAEGTTTETDTTGGSTEATGNESQTTTTTDNSGSQQQNQTQQQNQSQQQTQTQTQTQTQQQTQKQQTQTTQKQQTTQTKSQASGNSRQAAVNAALAQVGKAYSHSNNTGAGFDCNGLTNYAWSQAGVSIPVPSGHYSYGQFQWLKSSGRWVSSASALKPGDLVFYSYDGGRTTYHVAMYIGGGKVVQALSYRQGIQVTGINFCKGFCGGGSPI